MNRVDLMQFGSDVLLAAKAAEDWLELIASPFHSARPFTVALSGGRITKTFFAHAVQKARARGFSMKGVHFFWADERCVPPDHPESNYAVAQELLLEPLGIPASNIHRIRGELPPEEGARFATSELKALFPDTDPSPPFDLVFLGMGEDGHVASLFPGDPFEETPDTPWFRSVVASKPPPHRITMSYQLIQSAKQVWVLASGRGKKDALASSLISDKLPLGKVRTSRPSLRIFSDIRD